MPESTPQVRLLQVSIDGYRSCQSTEFIPSPQLSVLIGINGAGKTNLLNAIRLLSVRDVRFSPGAQSDQPADKITITVTFSVGERRIGLRLTLALSQSARSAEEILYLNEEWNLASIAKSRQWIEYPSWLYYNNPSLQRRYERDLNFMLSRTKHTDGPGAKPFGEVGRQLAILRIPHAMEAIKAVNEFRRKITYYSASQFTDPTRCPTNFELDGERRLDTGYRSASSHLTFLYDLYTLQEKNSELYKDYIAFIGRHELGLISRLSWKEIKLSSYTAEVRSAGSVKKVKRYKTLVVPRIQIGSSHLSFNQLSEGTFKTLAMIFYVMTDASSFLLIEEPEVCIHHGLLTKILGTIRAYSSVKQVVFSTHSDLVLDNVTQESVFVVEIRKGVTTVTNLPKWAGKAGRAALNEYLQEAGTLGEYWKSGGLAS